MTTRHWEGLEYHTAPARVKTNADKDGCQVFEITGPMGAMKVLALDEREAELAYKEDMYDDPEWCHMCRNYGFDACTCVEGEED